MRPHISKTHLLIAGAIILGAAVVTFAWPRLSGMMPAPASPDPAQTTSVRGDLDGDGDVDQNDIGIILAARNTKVSGSNDARDLNKDGKIDALDARIVTTLCTRTRCAIETVPEIAGFLSIQPNSFAKVSANQPQQVALNFAIPSGSAFGTSKETLQVRAEQATLAGTLGIVVKLAIQAESAQRHLSTALDTSVPFHTWSAKALGSQKGLDCRFWLAAPRPCSLGRPWTGCHAQAFLRGRMVGACCRGVKSKFGQKFVTECLRTSSAVTL